MQRIKNLDFKNLTSDILNRIHDLRTKRLAHNLEEYIKDAKNIRRINFDELEKLRDCANQLFENLSFGIGYSMVPLPYSEKVIHPEGSDSRPDIAKIFDSIAKESYFLNYPEKNIKFPILWDSKKKRMTKKELDIFYKYREKLGFPKI